MTFEDDFLIFVLPSGGKKRLRCSELGIQWPPPGTIRIRGFEPPFTDIDFKLLTMSTITDEQRASMTHVCRGAQYVCGVGGVQ